MFFVQLLRRCIKVYVDHLISGRVEGLKLKNKQQPQWTDVKKFEAATNERVYSIFGLQVNGVLTSFWWLHVVQRTEDPIDLILLMCNRVWEN